MCVRLFRKRASEDAVTLAVASRPNLEIYPGTRVHGEGAGNDFFWRRVQVEIEHCCASCGEVLAMHEHSSWQQVKDCQAGMRALCRECASWPGCPPPAAWTGERDSER